MVACLFGSVPGLRLSGHRGSAGAHCPRGCSGTAPHQGFKSLQEVPGQVFGRSLRLSDWTPHPVG